MPQTTEITDVFGHSYDHIPVDGCLVCPRFDSSKKDGVDGRPCVEDVEDFPVICYFDLLERVDF